MPSSREIADEYAARILNQELEQGTRLPSVRDLAAAKGVSTKTAHAVIRDLQARGLVSSHARGTIVSSRLSIAGPNERLQRQLAGLGPLRHRERAEISFAGWVPDPDHDDWHAQHVPIAVWDALELPEDTRVGRREYVTWWAKRLISLTVSWHPPRMVELVPALIELEPISAGTIGAAKNAGIEISTSCQTHVLARAADEREARLMQLPVGSPVLAVLSLRTDVDDRPIEYVESVYRTNEVLSFI